MLIRSVLFNFQGAFRRLPDDLFIISHLFEFVKYFLKYFLNIFRNSFQISQEAAFFSKAYLVYHNLLGLSRGISKFFENLFYTLCFRPPPL